VTFRFWGARGSVPSPLTPSAVKSKISAIVQRLRASDLESPESRERFLAGLPPDLFGHIGGNTTCFEVRADTGSDVFAVDAGTGLIELGRYYEAANSAGLHYHILLTHFHWDHIQGLPFFSALNNPKNKVTLYSPVSGFERYLHDQMRSPFFPVPLSIFPAKLEFVELGYQPLVWGSFSLSWKTVNHPGSCVCYRFEHESKTLVFSTDTELRTADFVKTPETLAFYHKLDVLIMDAQYTLGESIEKADWGHSSSGLAVDFALDFQVKTLYLFHHEPTNGDSRIEEIGRLAQWYSDHKKSGELLVRLAREGRWETLP
jgi:phosphoribosyl 1,2-cyclic phosphodiesterase